MIDDVLLDAEERMTASVEHTRNELATISVPEPRMLLIKPYDMSTMGEIENAIRNSDLGVNPTDDGQVIRVSVPQLTEERRKELVKQAKQKGEDGKIAIRNVRRQGMEALKKIQKDGDAGEDEVQTAEKALDKTTQGYVGQIDEIVQRKENELLEV